MPAGVKEYPKLASILVLYVGFESPARWIGFWNMGAYVQHPDSTDISSTSVVLSCYGSPRHATSFQIILLSSTPLRSTLLRF